MNEEIEIKLNDMKEKDKHHSIRINQDATVGDLINKIKESKEIVGNGQFLYLCCNNGGPNNGLLSVQQNMSLKLSDFKINNDSELSFDVFDINNSYTKKVLAELLADGCVVKIVQDGKIEIVFEKSIKYKSFLGKKFYTVLPMKLCNKIKDLITLGAHAAYYSYPIKNDRDCVYFKINFGDKIITDPENTDQNESLENMAIKQDSVLNMEITTNFDDQKVLTENGWVKAIDIIKQNKNKQQEEGNDESKEKGIKPKETNLIDENPQQQKENVKVNFNSPNQDKISDIKDPENTDQNESLENMAIKQGSVLNIEVATNFDDQKVLTENGWVKAIDIIEENKVEQEKEKKNVENLEIKEIDETEINLINKNPQASKSEKKNDYINNNDGKKQKNKDMAEEEKEDVKEIEEKIDLINSNPQQSNNEINVTFDFLGKDSIKFKVKPDITFNDLVEKFKTQALKKDKDYFKGIDEISFYYNKKPILRSKNSNTSLSEITEAVEWNITIAVIDWGVNGFDWNVSNINNKNEIFNEDEIPIYNYENQTPSSNWKRIFCFVVGIISLIAALVFFLVNPELLALIIPLTVSGGISLLVGFLWNTIKSCFIGSEPKEISNEPMPKENKSDPNKITNQNNPNNNLSPEKSTRNKSK